MQTTTELQTFPRPKISMTELATVTKRVRQASQVKLNQQIEICSKVLIENGRLYTQVDDLRGQRSFSPLRDDDDYTKAQASVQAAIDKHDHLHTLRLALFENIKCTREINIHRRALGLPEIPTFKA